MKNLEFYRKGDGKIRLDIFLVNNKYVDSREKAQRLIKEGKVYVNNQKITKPSKKVDENATIKITETEKYVSRAAYKLLKAIKEFQPKINNKICADIGSSTGGFTQVLLENGAKKVYCIDSGTNQLHESLRNNEKIVLMENTNARYLRKEDFESVEFFTSDVSFISITKIIPSIKEITANNAEGIILIKPQFELEPSKLSKGIVKKEEYREEAIKKVFNSLIENGFEIKGMVESPIRGKDGNIEYLVYIKKIN
ncbi:RNA methyltransferase [Marinitoga sp. 1135]|uniref:TlyA family RNA methyltransferase n=1 Tax=unclassified Marinitoga TaxID=2640159 RepID=UPI001586ADB1|nr:MULTISPECIES: TlyA family RNA methyltransferase [unclassified Marinitoga]NUU95205.1 RNA methyltransferase [Marinitoga sp. 1135]NUU97137.1 RNA methyltransferase [Marinitoga sp. 1138]